MKELKTHLPLREQVKLLLNRGLIIDDDNEVMEVLKNVNYYRLSGYLHSFKRPNSDCYIENLSWKRLKSIYDFDRKLTRILLYALEDVEETLKTRLSYTITSCYTEDPLIYLKPVIYRDYKQYLRFQEHFYRTKENNYKLPFVEHHYKEYNGSLPMWVAVELFTMGNLHAIYDNLIPVHQKALAKTFGTGSRQLSSWIENLAYTRNHLAHYMRIHNFNFGRTPAECKNHRREFSVTNMIFDQIHVMCCLYSDKSEWRNYILPEVKAIIDEYSSVIELSEIGFPEKWEELLRC